MTEKFRIKAYRKNKSVFVKAIGDKSPSFSPYEQEAHIFHSMASCKNVRDAVLVYVDKADIERIH